MSTAAPLPFDGELTIDQLAAAVGMTVRNVRAYAARGLLPPPRLVGRTGYYGRQHVARLTLVRQMLAEGHSLAVIERTLSDAPATSSATTLALHRALVMPWLPDEPYEIPAGDLASRAGLHGEDPDLLAELAELGVVEVLSDGVVRVLDPVLLDAGLEVVRLGIPPHELVQAQARVLELVRQIADVYVQLFRDTVWQPFAAAGAPPEDSDEMRRTVERVQPAAAQALLASFRTAMASAVARAVASELQRLGGDEA